MRIIKHFSLTVIGLMTGLTSMAPAADDPVKIGLLADLSGPLASLSTNMIDAAELAIDHINENGGLLGTEVQLVVADAACDAALAVNNATKLLDEDGVSALVGPYCSGAFMAVAEHVAIKRAVPILSPSAGAPDISDLDDNNFVFRLSDSADFEPKQLAGYFMTSGVETLAVTYMDKPYTQNFAGSFQQAYQQRGGGLAAFSAHKGEQSDYRNELEALAKSGAKHLLIIDYGAGSGATLLRQATEHEAFEQIFGNATMASVDIERFGNLENFTTFSSVTPDDGQALSRFKTLYTSQNGGHADGVFMAETFDAVFILALAIQSAGQVSSHLITEYIYTLNSPSGEIIGPDEWDKALTSLTEGQSIRYQGASGFSGFNGKGDVEMPMMLLTVQEKRLVSKKRL